MGVLGIIKLVHWVVFPLLHYSMNLLRCERSEKMKPSKKVCGSGICCVCCTDFLTVGSASTDDKKPKLVLQITVDQLRGDLPMRFKERLGKGGFRYLLEKGTHYNNANYQHANTETAVGHATLATGADPSQAMALSPMTGSIRKQASFVYCTEDDRHHIIGSKPKPHKGVSPRNLLASTLGDELGCE